MQIVYVMSILFFSNEYMTTPPSVANLSIPNNHYYTTYIECKNDADKVQAEADKIVYLPRSGSLYYICRPAPAWAADE